MISTYESLQQEGAELHVHKLWPVLTEEAVAETRGSVAVPPPLELSVLYRSEIDIAVVVVVIEVTLPPPPALVVLLAPPPAPPAAMTLK